MNTTLQIIAMACATVADNLGNPQNEHPHTLKKITGPPHGKSSFRFTTLVTVDGEQIEVTVRNYYPRHETPPAMLIEGLGKVEDVSKTN